MNVDEHRARLQAIADDDGAWVEEVLANATPDQLAYVNALVPTKPMPEWWLRRDKAYIIATFL